MFFLLSSERSGSNFITKLMNGHSNICGPSTKHIINPVARNLFRYEDIKIRKNWEQLVNDIFNLINIEFSIWEHKFTINELLSFAKEGDIKSLISNIFYAEAKANGKQHVFIKENHIYEFLPFLLSSFPESKYVYLVRDPRDMALSWKKNPSHSGGIVQAAKQWKKDQQQYLMINNFLSKVGSSYLVTYENLTSEVEKETKLILDFLGLPFDENIVNFHEDELTRKNAKKQIAWDNLSKAVISNNSKKYLNDLSEDEIKSIEKICYHEMNILGYKTEFDKNTLENFSDELIAKFSSNEIKTIEYKRTDGIIKNMEAKKVFYQKIINQKC